MTEFEKVLAECFKRVEKSILTPDGLAVDCADKILDAARRQIAEDKSVTTDLGDYINELSKQFPEVSFAKLSRIAVRVAKWQKEHLWKPADGEIYFNLDSLQYRIITEPLTDYHHGDKIKLKIVKED